MIEVNIRIVGLESLARLGPIMSRVRADISAYAKGMRPLFERQLVETINHVVYDVYRPTHYRRTYALLEAVASDYSEGPALGNYVQTLVFYNDPDKVMLRDDPISAGGSHKQDVMEEIEEGAWPTGRSRGWQGPTAPRPAFAVFGDMVGKTIHGDLLAILEKAVR